MNLIFILTTICLAAGLSLVSKAHSGVRSTTRDFSPELEQLQNLETIEAIRLYGRLGSYYPEAREAFRNAILTRRDLESFITQQLDELNQTPFNGNQRNYYFRVLSKLRTSWSAQICGKYLMSDETVKLPFKNEEETREFFEGGGSVTANSAYAMLALERMEIYSAPTKFGMGLPPGEQNRIDPWREWWLRNQTNIAVLLSRESSEKDDPKKSGATSRDLLRSSNQGEKEHSILKIPNSEESDYHSDKYQWTLIFSIGSFVISSVILLILIRNNRGT